MSFTLISLHEQNKIKYITHNECMILNYLSTEGRELKTASSAFPNEMPDLKIEKVQARN